jgi:hypothetical protein
MTHPRVLYFGDDAIACPADATGLGLVGRLTAATHAAGLPIATFNVGVLGGTTPLVIIPPALDAPPAARFTQFRARKEVPYIDATDVPPGDPAALAERVIGAGSVAWPRAGFGAPSSA